MYAQKFPVDVVIRGNKKPCPLDWLDQFCMRNFTNSADFDDTLPVADGRIEASYRLTPDRFAEGLSVWLTQRGKGEGQPVLVEVKSLYQSRVANPLACVRASPPPRRPF